MDSARSYHGLALRCMELAEAVEDPSTQDQLVQLADLCTRLAERAEEKARAAQAEHHQAA
jgi:hypothetical protein